METIHLAYMYLGKTFYQELISAANLMARENTM